MSEKYPIKRLYVSTTEYAKHINMDPRTVVNYIKAGIIKGKKSRSGKWLIEPPRKLR